MRGTTSKLQRPRGICNTRSRLTSMPAISAMWRPLMAKVGSIIKQAVGRRTFRRVNHAGDVNHLPAENVRTQNAGYGDGHPAKRRMPLRVPLQRRHIDARQRAPGFLAPMLVNALAGCVA